jgi:glycyl-tRNA synthetase
MLTVQDLVRTLQDFWVSKGCTLHFGHDVETGAGTFNPATFFRCLGPEPYAAAYVELCRRPKDGRYAENPNRMQLFHQYQVIIKPSPPDIQQLYLQSLQALGFHLPEHDIRFVHDDWEQPSLGAWGLGWEVWRDGMEITQFTYFQAVAGMDLHPITVELTYGIERIAMTLQNKDNVWDLQWDDRLTYGDIFRRNEFEWSSYNFDQADVKLWRRHLDDFRREARHLFAENLPFPALDFVMKASHAFNILDARGVVSVTERTGIIADIRDLAKEAAAGYLKQRAELNYPLLSRERPQQQVVQRPRFAMPAILAGSDDFILEIGSEELPATFVPIGIQSLQQALIKLLADEGLVYQQLQVEGTPRRLVAHVVGLGRSRPAQTSERRGPAAERAYDSQGKLTEVGEGFVRSLGDQGKAEIRRYKGTDYLFGIVATPPQSTAELLTRSLPKLIQTLDFPKKMRWGSSSLTYARPLRWILAMHGSDVIPFELDGIFSGRTSQAHPQISPGEIRVERASSYFDQLRSHHVLVSVEERKNSILQQLVALEQELDLQVLELKRLLPEVVHLVEWPLLTTASFDGRFLQAPAEVLISEMVKHQRDFPLADGEGRLTNRFVITADNRPSDEIRHGNVKVLSARLADGVFLYTQDLKVTLNQFNERLKAVIFRQELGTVYDKAQRIVANVRALHALLPLGDLETATRAAELCKADLASELVQEFPDLQGVIGRYYALAQGESLATARALAEHWMPVGEQGDLPLSPAGILVSLADKIDNLVSAFALNLKPSSASDPYGLRRQVLGIVKTLVHSKLRLPLRRALQSCYDAFLASTQFKPQAGLVSELLDFFGNRIKTVFIDYGMTKEETTAALSSGLDDIYDSFCRVQALHRFRSDPRFSLLAEVYKRAKGQFVGFESGAFSQKFLIEPQEKALAKALDDQQPRFEAAMKSGDYDQAYLLLADLQPKLASLFDHVRILADDPQLRANRISLLGKVFTLFGRLLDFSSLRL